MPVDLQGQLAAARAFFFPRFSCFTAFLLFNIATKVRVSASCGYVDLPRRPSHIANDLRFRPCVHTECCVCVPREIGSPHLQNQKSAWFVKYLPCANERSNCSIHTGIGTPPPLPSISRFQLGPYSSLALRAGVPKWCCRHVWKCLWNDTCRW